MELCKKSEIVILYGGFSSEREVSLITGKEIGAALEKNNCKVRYMDPIEFEHYYKMVEELIKIKPMIVFMALHGGEGEDGKIQALLELHNIPYTGSDSKTSALAMDKSISSDLVRSIDIPVPGKVLVKTSLMLDKVINMCTFPLVVKPNNAGSSVGISIIQDESELEEAVKFAKKYDILICHDFAYSEMTFDDYKASSFLEIEGAKDVGIEFHSLSKTYNMTGWRLGFAVGNKEAISALSIIKTNVDSGVFKAIQEAGIRALTGPQDNIEKMNKIYTGRRNVVINGLNKLGWNLKPTKATFYIWAPTLNEMSSIDFANLLLEKTGIIVTPGIGYGEYGEGYVRIALTVDEKRLEEAIERLEKSGITQE